MRERRSNGPTCLNGVVVGLEELSRHKCSSGPLHLLFCSASIFLYLYCRYKLLQFTASFLICMDSAVWRRTAAWHSTVRRFDDRVPLYICKNTLSQVNNCIFNHVLMCQNNFELERSDSAIVYLLYKMGNLRCNDTQWTLTEKEERKIR